MLAQGSLRRRTYRASFVGQSRAVLAFRQIFNAAARVPGVSSFLLFVLLYVAAEIVFSVWFFSLFSVWGPAFPYSWRFLLLMLAVVPLFTSLQLFRLSVERYTHSTQLCGWETSPDPLRGYLLLPRGDLPEEPSPFAGVDGQDHDLEDDRESEDPSRPGTSLHLSASHRHTSVWWPRFVLYLGLFCTSVIVALWYEQPGDVRYRSLWQEAVAHPRPAGYATQEKIFIAAMFRDNEKVIPYWSDSIIKTIHYLGSENVFVSIIESHSRDRSPELLLELDAKLAALEVSRRILIHDNAVERPDDMEGNNRINFLAALRNRALEPLVEEGGYDKVVFSNDIFIEPESFIELLNTADGQYDMACGMDFAHFGAYDMWVLRDRQGKLTSGIWPYFFDERDHQAMLTESPVPVFTCWNGIIVVQADPLIPILLRSNRTLSPEALPYDLPSTHPAAHDPSLRGPSPALTPPARFRASAPGECFSSESFLLPYDLRRLFNMQRIYVNPRVIVGYQWRFYAYFKWFMRHPVLKWWIEKVYAGAWMQKGVFVLGDPTQVWWWDGGDCHPGW